MESCTVSGDGLLGLGWDHLTREKQSMLASFCLLKLCSTLLCLIWALEGWFLTTALHWLPCWLALAENQPVGPMEWDRVVRWRKLCISPPFPLFISTWSPMHLSSQELLLCNSNSLWTPVTPFLPLVLLFLWLDTAFHCCWCPGAPFFICSFYCAHRQSGPQSVERTTL